MSETKTFDAHAAMMAQFEFQKKTGSPALAPGDGRCWNCKRNIYEEVVRGDIRSGYTVERASTSLITGCPHCHRSYCD